MRRHLAAGFAVLMVLAQAPPGRAQMLDRLKGAAGIGQGSGQDSTSGSGLGGALGGLGGGAMPSVGSAGSGNIAGVLGYCMRNKYLGGGDAGATQSGLLGRLGGAATGSEPYQAGESGQLQTGQGNFSLGGGGLKAKLTQKICDQVLSRARSLI